MGRDQGITMTGVCSVSHGQEGVNLRKAADFGGSQKAHCRRCTVTDSAA